MENNYAVIMAGGIGSRFWPMSKESLPKQFLDVLGIGKSLIQMTYERFSLIVSSKNIFIVTNERYKKIVLEQLPNIDESQILSEPERKNTAPCIAFASHKIYSSNPNANLIVSPSDHLILNETKFKKNIYNALKTSENEKCLVTLGIKPTRPDTGFGYIQFHQDGDLIPGSVKSVKQFTEKPNLELAKLFLTSGEYYWNSGIFVWKAKTIIAALSKFTPELNELFSSEFIQYGSNNELLKIRDAFKKCEDVSIDFAVMENAKNVKVVLANFDWSDLGTWGSVYSHLEKDSCGNAIIGNNTEVFDSHNCIINLPNEKLALIQGLNNHIVIESDGVLMILDRENEQQLKEYLKKIKSEKPEYF